HAASTPNHSHECSTTASKTKPKTWKPPAPTTNLASASTSTNRTVAPCTTSSPGSLITSKPAPACRPNTGTTPMPDPHATRLNTSGRTPHNGTRASSPTPTSSMNTATDSAAYYCSQRAS